MAESQSIASPQRVLVALKSHGRRMTPQRRLIFEAVTTLERPFTAERVHDYVLRRFPDFNLATVYRTLETLEELGFIKHVHAHAGVASYHLADDTVQQQLVCVSCGAHAELDLAFLEPLAAELRRRFGFEPVLGHTAIVGRCRACAHVDCDSGGSA